MPVTARARLALALGLAVALSVAMPAGQGQATSYTVISAQNRRTLAVRSQGNTDVVALDQLAPVFDLTATEDAVVGGLTINARGQRILVIPGQNFAQVNGRVLSLSGPIARDRNGMYQLPIDFVSVALARALNTRIEVRRPSRLIIVGDIAVPRVTIHVDRQANAARVTFEIEPTAPHRVTREGNSITVRFDAAALDMAPTTGQAPEFLKSVRVQGTTVFLDLGPQTALFTNEDDRDQTHLTVELQPTPPPPPPTPTPAPSGPPVAGRPGGPPQEAPLPDFSHLGGLHTIVIDPGHGGDDLGVQGPGGTKEKDLTLQIARRVRATVESRMGLRVLLTRDTDENVPLDRRTAFANNNKADVLVSLHVNAALVAAMRGAQVYTLSLDEYKGRDSFVAHGVPVPVVGGGTRSIDVVPWDFAQLPFADRSAGFGSVLVRQLAAHNVPLNAQPAVQAPLRLLVGANMPAALVEMGFLTNADDEKGLAGATAGAVVESIVGAISELRSGLPAIAPAPAPAIR